MFTVLSGNVSVPAGARRLRTDAACLALSRMCAD